MKKTSFFFPMLIIGFILVPLTSMNAQVTGIQWNTFFGSANTDHGYGIAVDSSGNIYMIGDSDATWGSPVNAHSGSEDAFVACLDSSGNLTWNTFLGSSSWDYCYGITLDSSGNIYVTGWSVATWGTPVHAFNGAWDAFVACLDSSGNLLWNTFLGSSSGDYGQAIALDSSGNIYVTGKSDATWGSPVNPISAYDVFVACLDSSGNLLWNTFLGSSDGDWGNGIDLDSSGNLYVTGYSNATWGTPVNAHGGGEDALVACLNSSGSLLWHTFLGSSSDDGGEAIVLDGTGNVYVTGDSGATWGSPVNPYSGGVYDALVACLDSSGNLLWHTFLGSSSTDYGRAIVLDSSGNIIVSGYCGATWGLPINPYSGNWDAVVSTLDSSGHLLWNTFLGSTSADYNYGIALDNSENIYMAGHSLATWGSPINAHSGSYDVFVAKITPPLPPHPDITANGLDGPISITQSDTLQIRVSLNSNGLTANVDFWLAYKGPSGWVHYNNATKKWETGLGVTHQGALFDINNKKVFQSSGLSPGTYRFYFGVDMNMNGIVTKSSLYKDEVKVTVTQ